MSFLNILCKSFNSILTLKNVAKPTTSVLNSISIRSLTTYKSSNLWNAVLSVSSQGSKKGRGKGRAGSLRKNLNVGQEIGDGAIKMQWPGLNAPLLVGRKLANITVVGEDKTRQERLIELRANMDRFRRLSIPPNERGWSGGIQAGRSIGEPISESSEVIYEGFDTRCLEVKNVATVTALMGKKRSASVFVVTGNKNGVVGFGSGKASLPVVAKRLAKANASRRLIKIDLFENRTLFHNFYQEYYYSKIFAEKKPAGYGLRCHRVIKTICEMLGIKDIYVKSEGSVNTKNLAMAFFTGLLNQNKYQDIANEKGLHVVERRPETNYYPLILASPTDKPVKRDSDLKDENEKDFDLFLLNNRYRKKSEKLTPFYNEYPRYKKYLEQKKTTQMQQRLKAKRAAFLDDDILQTTMYPQKPIPKPPQEGEGETTAV